ncbi:DUF6158 family protein [Micromonospora sp. NPDC000207]|uniref:DUF6158 family protein n=1 Tax=Micromonospora sp. NPDC000207 TaxID=3154246 RepID=UPI0033303CF8
MSDSVRQNGVDAATVGETSPEQRVPEWDTSAPTPGGTSGTGDLLDEDVVGIDPAELDDDDLLREVHSLHRTRLDTLRHASDSALANHLRRTAELETEYLARHPGREVDPSRLRSA